MRFVFHDAGLRPPFLCVDGVVEDGLNLSHWPGNRTPIHLKADTTTEMAMNLARDPLRDRWLDGIEIVTNNHFDTDGLLSVFAVLRPREALAHEAELVRAARTGDFGDWTTPEAFKVDAVVTAHDDDVRSPLAAEIRGLPARERTQRLYDHLLAALPGLLTEASARKDLWGAGLQDVIRSMMRFKDVARVREHDGSRLSVIEAREPLAEMARFNMARHHRVLTATSTPDGPVYDLAFRIHTWFDTVTPPRGGRFDVTDAGARLDALETSGDGRWTFTGVDALDCRLFRAGPDGSSVASSLPLATVEEFFVHLCRGRA